jgi:hypothetical protein
VKNLATIAAPLRLLIKKNSVWKWTKSQEIAFEKLKSALTTAPVLAYPDFTKPFELHTDASNEGIGATLVQKQEDGTERVIAYYSRALTDTEKRYHTFLQEALALVAACRKFRVYLLYKKFTVYTDHQALLKFKNTQHPDAKSIRWSIYLSDFDFEIHHRKGVNNTDGDALSRPPIVHVRNTQFFSSETNETHILKSDFQKLPEPLLRLFYLQRLDPELSRTIHYLQNPKSFANYGNVAKLAHESKPLSFDKFGILCKLRSPMKDEEQVPQLTRVVPRALVANIIEQFHDIPSAGHLGFNRVYHEVRKRFWWKGMKEDIKQHIKTCDLCQTGKISRRLLPGAPMGTVEAHFPFEILAIDLVGKLPRTADQNNSYILTCVDYFTRYAIAIPIPDKKSSTVAKALFKHVLMKHGAVSSIVSDRGGKFDGVSEELFKLINIDHRRTVSYHPQANGLVERWANYTI